MRGWGGRVALCCLVLACGEPALPVNVGPLGPEASPPEAAPSPPPVVSLPPQELPDVPSTTEPPWAADWSESEPVSPEYSWGVSGARISVSGGQALLGMMLRRIVSMEETEDALAVLRWDGLRWVKLGEPTPLWPAQWGGKLVAWGADGVPFRVRVEQQGIAVERWDGQDWHRILEGLGFRSTPEQPPACVSLLSGRAGLVLAWREGLYDHTGATHVGLLKPDTGTWERLGEALVPQPGQVFWSCPDFVLDPAGHPVVTWDENLLDSNRHTIMSEIRVARWDASSRGWKQLGRPFQAGAAPRVNWYPRVSVGPDDAPVVSWVAQPGRGQGLQVHRFNTARGTWEPLGVPAEPPAGEAFASVRSLLHDGRGRPITCVFKERSHLADYTQGLYCQRFEGGAWAPVGAQPLLAGQALELEVAPDSEDRVIVLGSKLQSLRLYRQAPAEATP